MRKSLIEVHNNTNINYAKKNDQIMVYTQLFLNLISFNISLISHKNV